MPAMPSNADLPGLSRRDFLTLAWKSLLGLSGLLGLGGLWRYLSFQPDPDLPHTFDLGPAGKYPLNSRTILPEAKAVLMHTPAGFHAISLVCPHLGCSVDKAEDGYSCPCHGSQFDSNGALLRGPADKPLRNLRLELTKDGRLVINTA
jgi:cytochrome b6-f complex iron-sulfur subunit